MKLLSILIPTTPDRHNLHNRLVQEIDRQMKKFNLEEQVETLTYQTASASSDPSNRELTTGYKRNKLVQNCTGKYYAFIDDDDMPNRRTTYISKGNGIYKDVDCCSLIRAISIGHGKKLNPFHHSIKYTKNGGRTMIFIIVARTI